ESLVVQCCTFALFLDVVSLIVLFLCYIHSRRVYIGLSGVGRRYQIREVEYLTCALLPACLITVLLRTVFVVIALVATIFSSIFPPYMIVMAVVH
ncbi:hypothetical protein PMAYCL1PPCAC_21689, partial [Pristionchus mayeri]